SQAEDGIRDRNVTGVQTCALPIWFRRRHRRRHHDDARPPARTLRPEDRRERGREHHGTVLSAAQRSTSGICHRYCQTLLQEQGVVTITVGDAYTTAVDDLIESVLLLGSRNRTHSDQRAVRFERFRYSCRYDWSNCASSSRRVALCRGEDVRRADRVV